MNPLNLDELLAVRHLVSSRIAAHSDYADNGPLHHLGRRTRMMAAIEEADFAKRLASGSGIETVADYREWKADDAPSMATLIRTFGGWRQAKKAAGILADREPQTDLVRRDGRAASRKHGWTEQEITLVMAQALELNYGRRLTVDAYEQMRGDRPDWPSHTSITDPKQQRSKSQGEWFDLAKALILNAGPYCYPHAYRRLSAQRGPGRG